jgi:hypothetical protein
LTCAKPQRNKKHVGPIEGLPLDRNGSQHHRSEGERAPVNVGVDSEDLRSEFGKDLRRKFLRPAESEGQLAPLVKKEVILRKHRFFEDAINRKIFLSLNVTSNVTLPAFHALQAVVRTIRVHPKLRTKLQSFAVRVSVLSTRDEVDREMKKYQMFFVPGGLIHIPPNHGRNKSYAYVHQLMRYLDWKRKNAFFRAQLERVSTESDKAKWNALLAKNAIFVLDHVGYDKNSSRKKRSKKKVFYQFADLQQYQRDQLENEFDALIAEAEVREKKVRLKVDADEQKFTFSDMFSTPDSLIVNALTFGAYEMIRHDVIGEVHDVLSKAFVSIKADPQRVKKARKLQALEKAEDALDRIRNRLGSDLDKAFQLIIAGIEPHPGHVEQNPVFGRYMAEITCFAVAYAALGQAMMFLPEYRAHIEWCMFVLFFVQVGNSLGNVYQSARQVARLVGIEENPGPFGVKKKGKKQNAIEAELKRGENECCEGHTHPPEECKDIQVRPPPRDYWNPVPGNNHENWLHDLELDLRRDKLLFEQMEDSLFMEYAEATKIAFEEEIRHLPPIYFGWCTDNPALDFAKIWERAKRPTHIQVELTDYLTGIQDYSELTEHQRMFCEGQIWKMICASEISPALFGLARSVDSLVKNSAWNGLVKGLCRVAVDNICNRTIGESAKNFWRVTMKITRTEDTRDFRKPTNRTVSKLFDEIYCDVTLQWVGMTMKGNGFKSVPAYTDIVEVESFHDVRFLSCMDSFVSNPFLSIRDITNQSHANLNRLSSANCGWMRFNTGPEHRLMSMMAASLSSHKNSLN